MAEPSNEDIIVWPDGTWCRRQELPEYGWMSDDFRVIPFGSAEWDAFTEDWE